MNARASARFSPRMAAKKSIGPDPRMRLVTYNIRYSLGQDERYDLARVVRAVEGADIIALQEVERFWPRSGMADQPAEIAAMLPGYHWVYGPAFDVDGSESLADGTVRSRRRQFGPMLLSKTPILSSRLHVLPKMSRLEGFNMDTGALEGVIMTGLGHVRIYSLHLSATDPSDRLLQLDWLFAILRRAVEDGGAWSGEHHVHGKDWSCGEAPPPIPEACVLMGDFNAEPDSEEYRRLTQTGAESAAADATDRLTDAWAAAGKGPDDVFTWTPYPGAVPNREMRLDYCFVTGNLGARVTRAWVDHEALGSDHYPCWFDIGAP